MTPEIIILLALLLVSFGVSTFSKSKDLRSCGAVICAGAAVVCAAAGGLAVFFADFWGSSGSGSKAGLWLLALSGLVVGIMLVMRLIRWRSGLGKQQPPPQGGEEKSRSSEPPLYPGD